MVRAALLVIAIALTFTASGASRYVTDREASPVRWQEWGRAALQRAQKEKRPLFVSVGYAASWDCQRMHREAFLNGEVAEALNAYFVPVLVDRIEHPEIAETLEAVLRSMQGEGGWPANLILTPDLQPVRGARFLTTSELSRMLVIEANRWAHERAAVLAEGTANLAKAKSEAEGRTPSDVDATTIEAVVDDIGRAYEQEQTLDAMTIAFLFRYSARTRNENLRTLAAHELRRLAASPMRDPLGGGFHRCATCYEKLLSDQALLAMAYLDAWRITRDPDLAHVARTTLDAAMRDLVPPRGLFQSAQDAHSLVPGQGPVFVEGAFYRWTKEEIVKLVGEETAKQVLALFTMSDGRLSLADPRFLSETREELAAPLQRLLDVRQTRPSPFRENPVAGWNGLMVSALARGAAALHEEKYLDAASNAATLLSAKLWNAQKKTLSRTESGTPALAEDYAMVVQGLLDLFESSSEPKWLELAIALQQRQDGSFWDASAGRYETGGSVPEALRGLLRERDAETPSVNAIAATNLLRLASLTGNEVWRERPAMIFQSFGGKLRTAGATLPQLASAYEISLITPSIVAIVGDPRKEQTMELLQSHREVWQPMRVVLLVPHKGAQRERLLKALPFLRALAPDPERALEYVCASGSCVKR